MAEKCYVGVNGVARSVDKMYVGVNGVARKVVKGYVGVNGVAQPFWSDGSTPFALIDSLYNTSGTTLNQITVNGCSQYENLLVIIGCAWKTGIGKSHMEAACYLDQGTVFSQSAGSYEGTSSSSHIFRGYVVPVTSDTMVLTGTGISHYQIYGVNNGTISEIVGYVSNGGVITSYDASIHANNYDFFVFMGSTSWKEGGSIDDTRPYLYINQGETAFSGYYLNLNYPSTYVLSYASQPLTHYTGRWFGYMVLGINWN